jgi:hypothetical protein
MNISTDPNKEIWRQVAVRKKATHRNELDFTYIYKDGKGKVQEKELTPKMMNRLAGVGYYNNYKAGE